MTKRTQWDSGETLPPTARGAERTQWLSGRDDLRCRTNPMGIWVTCKDYERERGDVHGLPIFGERAASRCGARSVAPNEPRSGQAGARSLACDETNPMGHWGPCAVGTGAAAFPRTNPIPVRERSVRLSSPAPGRPAFPERTHRQDGGSRSPLPSIAGFQGTPRTNPASPGGRGRAGSPNEPSNRGTAQLGGRDRAPVDETNPISSRPPRPARLARSVEFAMVGRPGPGRERGRMHCLTVALREGERCRPRGERVPVTGRTVGSTGGRCSSTSTRWPSGT
jgi:hypothetical protein